ncbi:MAG TPA: TonB-dependent receptor [Candidatus Polarisedimenticolia bacterium]|nr:TonB-dependent receptor [Candidatus Polarisedimenticolia bacterium]
MKRTFLILAGLTLAVLPAAAQAPNNAGIHVIVTDPSGAVVPGATVTVTNTATGASRQATTGADGSVTMAALPLNGVYKVSVSMPGFVAPDVTNLVLRDGERAAVKFRLQVAGAQSEITVFGTAEGVRADAQLGLRLEDNQIEELPILGRKVSNLPLMNSAFRQGKGTGDLFVNTTYFVTGVGSRRATTFTIDGGTNDEGWGRQTVVATVPIGAVREVAVLSNSFSTEYGWTSGAALNMVTKSGTNDLHGDLLYLNRPGGNFQAKSFSTSNFCPDSVSTCVTPSTLNSISPVDIPDTLNQGSGSIGGPIFRDKTWFFAAADYTAQNRVAPLSPTLPAFVLPADGSLTWTGHYKQTLVDARADHSLTDSQSLMFRFNFDQFYDDNPQDAVGGTSAPSVARRYSREGITGQLNHTAVISPEVVNEARVAYLWGDPVTNWEAPNLTTTYTRAGNVPFTVGQSRFSDLYSHQFQFADTLSWSRGIHSFRFGTTVARHTSGGTGSEPGTPVLGTFTFKPGTTAPLDQLTLNDVQSYTQPIDFGIHSYDLSQWLVAVFAQDSLRPHPDVTVDVGLRYDLQTLTDATTNISPRVGFGWHPGGDARTSVRGGYGMYYTQIRSNAVASYLVNGLDGLTTYTAVPGQFGFPTCLTCVPIAFDPRVLPPSQLPARDITIQAGQADFYRAQFARYGLNFDLLPNYPDKLVNPRSQVISIGGERDLGKGLLLAADYVHQRLDNIDRTVDLNAPTPFDRTAPGQVRSVAAANATRPILPVNGGVRQVNVLMNLGEAEYNALQTQLRYRNPKLEALVTYTLSKATNTTEPDGNGIGPNDGNLASLGEQERGPSVLDQRHRGVVSLVYRLPYDISIGGLGQFASARPFNATTGVDNNGDGANNDRPVVNGQVLSKSPFRGSLTSQVDAFLEGQLKVGGGASVILRVEGFNLFNHGNYLGRGQTIYGNAEAPVSTFGQLVAAGSSASAIPAFANVDPPRMFQFSARFAF